MTFDWLVFLTEYWSEIQMSLVVLSLLTVFDLLLGVIVSWRKGEFEWVKVGDVAVNNVPKLLVYVIVALLVQVARLDPEGVLNEIGLIGEAANGLAVIIGLSIGGSLLGHVAYLVPGWQNGTKKFGIKST